MRKNTSLNLLTLFLVCFLVLFASPPATAQDNSSKIVKESILSNKKKRTYYLFVPATAKAPAPLIVLLHWFGTQWHVAG